MQGFSLVMEYAEVSVRGLQAAVDSKDTRVTKYLF
jgi:hypothetical protein